VRFSKDKTPYKTHFGLTWHRTKPLYSGGYYLHLSTKNNFLACSFWDPNPADLKRIRQEIDMDGEEYRSILNNKTFKSVWGELQGEAVKTAPMGNAKDHPILICCVLSSIFSQLTIQTRKSANPTLWTALTKPYKPCAPLWTI
jgi:uncharacterized protein (TIGR02453 family)